jgi:hypothetical protein
MQEPSTFCCVLNASLKQRESRLVGTWHGFLTSAAGGALGGAAAGIVPLALGLYRRKPKVAVGLFFGCVIGGAIGGVYAAVAAMGVGLGGLMRRKDAKTPEAEQR